MKKIIIRYRDCILKAHISEDTTTIFDSYKVKSIFDMEYILHYIRAGESADMAINTRGILSMVNEWRVHNLLYSLGILKDRVRDVDLNTNQPWYIKTLYFLLSPFYLHFY